MGKRDEIAPRRNDDPLLAEQRVIRQKAPFPVIRRCREHYVSDRVFSGVSSEP